MLVRFTSPAAASVSMFEKDAKAILRMMGHSATIPSALRAEDIPHALEQLQTALLPANSTQDDAALSNPEHDEAEKPVSINVRAYPLTELLKAAASKQKMVMWEYEQQLF